jgi:non-heme chloroperoxidase
LRLGITAGIDRAKHKVLQIGSDDRSSVDQKNRNCAILDAIAKGRQHKIPDRALRVNASTPETAMIENFLTAPSNAGEHFFAPPLPLRRNLLIAGLSASVLAAASAGAATRITSKTNNPTSRESREMNYVTTDDGVDIFYKDWGPKDAQALVFHHGWPLSADDWDAQMLCFLGKGYRVIAHDRRGHGRSSQVNDGHDMDHYAADFAAVAEHLDLRNAIHIGHSTGGGEATHYVAKHGQPNGRVAKLVLIGAVPPIMVKT